uniref:Ig-like domain-containing protein n=1 Tax=Chelydra serpentina TaxID=8475 RepID=A0A8C3SRY9_CHESE
MALALNMCSFIAGRRSINVTTLTSAGNIGEDGILGCTFEPDIKLSNIEIRWAKAGVSGMVHEFKGGKDHLKNQDEVFKGRTAVFAEQVIGGNASLMLRDVQLSDAGAYRCSVTTSKGNGEAGLEYKTGGEENLVKEPKKTNQTQDSAHTPESSHVTSSSIPVQGPPRALPTYFCPNMQHPLLQQSLDIVHLLNPGISPTFTSPFLCFLLSQLFLSSGVARFRAQGERQRYKKAPPHSPCTHPAAL